MNHNQELYESITKAKINESIHLVTKLILRDPDKNYTTILYTFIAVCSYIGSFISSYDIRLLLDTIVAITDFIDDENIVIKNVYLIVTKLCIICDIYLKNPVTKTGQTNLAILRQKIIDMFTMEKFKLSDSGMALFEGILPPADSPTYSLATQIITGYVHIIKELDALDMDKQAEVANKIRKSFDYIIRKKYAFETKFYESDSDPVWFLWGIISLMFKDREMDTLYQLFNIGYSKKNKIHRVGLLWAAGITMVYIKKRDIARNWNHKEINVIKKINELSMDLYQDIKRKLVQDGDIEIDVQPKQKRVDGLEYILGVRHNIALPDKNNQEDVVTDVSTSNGIKYIKYKRRFY